MLRIRIETTPVSRNMVLPELDPCVGLFLNLTLKRCHHYNRYTLFQMELFVSPMVSRLMTLALRLIQSGTQKKRPKLVSIMLPNDVHESKRWRNRPTAGAP